MENNLRLGHDIPSTPNKEGISNASGFVQKLYNMVNHAPDDIISWVPDGEAFRISDLQRLENETLPSFFRHSRFQSLVRQLNFYNFRKVNRERNFWIYHHKQFHRDRPDQLHLLRRRTCPGVDGRKQRPEIENSNQNIIVSHDSSINQGLSLGSDINGKKNQTSHLVDYRTPPFLPNERIHIEKHNNRFHNMSIPDKNQHVRHDYENLLLAAEVTEGNSAHSTTPSNYGNNIRMTNEHKNNRVIVHHSKNKPVHLASLDKLYLEGHASKQNYPHQRDINEEMINHSFMNREDREKPDLVGRNTATDIVTLNSLISNENNENRPSSAVVDLKHCTKLKESEIEVGIINAKKQRLDEENRHSLIVSQVSRELQIYAKRAAESGSRHGKGKSGRGARRVNDCSSAGRGNGALVTPTPVLGDTMKYNALTYDDEVSGSDLDDRMQNKKRKAETVVTDESDNSEADDLISGVAKTSMSALPFCVGKLTEIGHNSNKFASEFAKENIHFQMNDSNNHLLASLSKKLLNGLGPQKLVKDQKSQLISASISCFCMTSNPIDPQLESQINQLLNTCRPLDTEFQQYREALSPDLILNSNTCPSVLNQKRSRKIYDSDAMRDFKIYAVNCMEDILRQNSLFLHKESSENITSLDFDEARFLKTCTETWCKNISA